ncbi:TPA: dTDP-4-dehydrorhamnose reductase [Proteus mirabilis]|uniref:dTDP-4-dehydrorhamnose reductase n=1 Tax=Proteus mirabilis TaxID=584 RepID=A0A385JNF7_PROMI|nr:rmlD [Proteus mirabilis]OOQ55586.1 NAD(P)-dependent oxidoreductase [Proteus mirabilis]HCT6782620.1 dTDP-4-dehydrorhamnose reductase [Proteus mirabilis]HEK0791926.1 dTDP-4-dehydrorhamnose reductase [Proteus mirabilis]
MKIILFGKNGQVGWELQRSLVPLGTVIALDSKSIDYKADFLFPLELEKTILSIKPDIIVNAAAYTNVDNAETDDVSAFKVNSESVEVIAKTAEKIGALLIHYSTDYVFDGTNDIPWLETDTPAPLNIYGKSKLAGELAIINNCKRHLIFRTSWVYASKGNNFAKTMLKLGKSHDSLSIIDDQYGAPTSAELLADCTAHAIKSALDNESLYGLYHLTAKGTTTWFEYASLIFEYAQEYSLPLTVKNLIPIPAKEYPLPAFRPHNSRLNTQKFETNFKLELPHWKFGIYRMLNEILDNR